MRVRSSRGMRKWLCPFCALRVLGDDQALTIHHEEPVCAGFKAKLSALWLKPIAVERTGFLEDD